MVTNNIIDSATTTHTEYIDGRGNVTSTHFDKTKFAKKLFEDVIQTLQQEWYNLNSQVPPIEETPRELGIRIGRKVEVVKLIQILKDRYEPNL